MSSMQVSSGRPHMQTSNQRGRGKDPVVVLGRIRWAVAVNITTSGGHSTPVEVGQENGGPVAQNVPIRLSWQRIFQGTKGSDPSTQVLKHPNPRTRHSQTKFSSFW